MARTGRNAVVNPEDFLEVAEGLANGEGPGRPRQVELRRAVSTTYYALFHTLANTCADLLVGPRSTSQTNQAWRQAYRALDHGEVKTKCTRGPGKPILDNHFPQAIRNFARQFVKMQESRHKADYDPFEPFTRSGVLQFIQETKTAINDFEGAPLRDRRAFAVFVLFKLRRE